MKHTNWWLVLCVPHMALAQRLTVDTAKVRALSGDSAGAPFVRVRSATRTAAGIVIADAKSPAVLLFDHRGTFLRQIGREGSGPGEYRSPLWVGGCGTDSLFVWDSQEQRVSVFSQSGAFVRQFRTPAGGSQLRCTSTGIFALLMFPSGGTPPPPDGRSRADSAEVRLLSRVGDSLSSIRGVAFADGRFFGRITVLATYRRELMIGTAEGPWVEWYSGEGRFARKTAMTLPTRPTSTASHERAVDRMLDAMRLRGDRRSAQRSMLLSLPIPKVYAPYRDVSVSPNGTIWVTLTSPEDGDREGVLRAFDMRGTEVGSATLPRAVRLLEAGDDYLLVTYESDEGVLQVAMMRVRKAQ